LVITRYWEYGSGYGDYYDWLPDALLVREAGDKVSDPAGMLFTWGTRRVLAGNPALSEALACELLIVDHKERIL